MRIPAAPPSTDLSGLTGDGASGIDAAKLMRIMGLPPVDARGRYFSWDDMRHRAPPDGLTHREWWTGTRLNRQAMSVELPLRDRAGTAFFVVEPEPVRRALHRLDMEAGGTIGFASPIANEEQRRRYLVSSLIEEAFSSSVLEGAATTRQAAKEMIREGRRPRSHDEQMVLNNYQAMEFVRGLAGDAITPQAVLELHRVVTHDTLDDPTCAGRFRRSSDAVTVVDERTGDVLHVPPPAAELPRRLKALCRFANAPADSTPFIHPIVRSIVLHFIVGYDHPFVDGNGRTARALFYWSMGRHGYWLAEFLSISRVLKRAPARYVRAYLHSEIDGGDLTYFVIHQLDVLARAIADLHDYLEAKATESREAESLLNGTRLRGRLNRRQAEILQHAIDHPGAQFTIKGHAAAQAVSYLTARKDLEELQALDLLIKRRQGRGNVFAVPADLMTRLRER